MKALSVFCAVTCALGIITNSMLGSYYFAGFCVFGTIVWIFILKDMIR